MINEIWIPSVTGPIGTADEDIKFQRLFGAACCYCYKYFYHYSCYTASKNNTTTTGTSATSTTVSSISALAY